MASDNKVVSDVSLFSERLQKFPVLEIISQLWFSLIEVDFL